MVYLMAVLKAYDRGAGAIALFNLSDANSIQSVFLGAATAETLTIPAGVKSVIFRSDGPFYFKVDSNPSIPTTEVTSGGSIYVPADIWDGDNWEEGGAPTDIRFIRANATDTIISVLFYA